VLAELDLGDGHHPVLLDEALAALPGTPAQIEVKNWPIDAGFEPDHRIALETAERARPGDVVTSFNPVSLETVRRVFPDVPTGLCVMAGVPLDDAVERCLDAGHRALVPDESMVIEEVDATIEIYPWTVNDPKRARELVEIGVAGIITDDPGLMAGILRSQ
jgi:glycerophosphoryl diester phosphodiesterase